MPPLLAAVSAVIEVELPADVRGNGKLQVLTLQCLYMYTSIYWCSIAYSEYSAT
jgi:hypothetical protein